MLYNARVVACNTAVTASLWGVARTSHTKSLAGFSDIRHIRLTANENKSKFNFRIRWDYHPAKNSTPVASGDWYV
jgi:hypothetical protein